MPIASTLSVVLALLATLAAILIAGRLLKMTRFGGASGSTHGRIGIVESVALDPRRRLVLVRCDQRCALVLLGQQDQIIGWVPDATS